MRIAKIILGILAGVWTMWQAPGLVDLWSPNDTSGHPLSYKLGALTAFLISATICIALFGNPEKS